MMPGFQDADLSESMERGGGGNALQVSRKWDKQNKAPKPDEEGNTMQLQ